MNIKVLKEFINDLPDDYEFCLEKIFIINASGLYNNDDNVDSTYYVKLHDPITGISWNDDNKEVVLILDAKQEDGTKNVDKKWYEERFGSVYKLIEGEE
jgi:hypothetical protein